MTARRPSAAAAVALLTTAALAGCSNTKGYTIPSDSMAPALSAGEHFEAEPVDTYAGQRGDVVVFADPGGWLVGGDETDGKLVKRVIGIDGDVIRCCNADGWLVINGEPLDESSYLPTEHGPCAAEVLPRRDACDWKVGPVPTGTIFVLGDNRQYSVDSRSQLCEPGAPSCTKSPFVDTDLVGAVADLS